MKKTQDHAAPNSNDELIISQAYDAALVVLETKAGDVLFHCLLRNSKAGYLILTSPALI